MNAAMVASAREGAVVSAPLATISLSVPQKSADCAAPATVTVGVGE